VVVIPGRGASTERPTAQIAARARNPGCLLHATTKAPGTLVGARVFCEGRVSLVACSTTLTLLDAKLLGSFGVSRTPTLDVLD
jgi:hypothetical protein